MVFELFRIKYLPLINPSSNCLLTQHHYAAFKYAVHKQKTLRIPSVNTDILIIKTGQRFNLQQSVTKPGLTINHMQRHLSFRVSSGWKQRP